LRRIFIVERLSLKALAVLPCKTSVLKRLQPSKGFGEKLALFDEHVNI